MSKIVQEKFQVNYPQQSNDDATGENHDHGGWITDAVTGPFKGAPGTDGW